MKNCFELREIFPVSAEKLYKTWVDAGLHGKMIGSTATGSGKQGETFTAWDGYISGKNIELQEPSRIVQSWRTTDFEADEPDSKIEINLTDVEGGCELSLKHSEIPSNKPDYEMGWKEYYFKSMHKYFKK